jgi:hypothetical protein
MSDQPSDQQGAELTPEQEAEVRRLLADARHDEPIPTAVADRLDTVLAGLTRDEPGSPGVAPVIDLAARRRGRNAAALLAGAAAVIVAGFVGGQVIDVGSSDDDAGSASSGTAADRASSEADKAAPEAAAGGGDSSLAATPSPPAPASSAQVLQLRSAHLAKDVRDQLFSYSASADSAELPTARDFSSLGCTPPPSATKFGLGDLFPALYDNTPAVLAVRPSAGGGRQADVLDCDTAGLLASVTVPSR